MTDEWLHISTNDFGNIKFVSYISAFAFFTALQLVAPHHRPVSRDFKNWPINLGLGAFNSICVAFTMGAFMVQLTNRIVESKWGLMQLMAVPWYAQILIAIFSLDFLTYSLHRVYHVWPMMWRFHQVHHSDLNFDTSTAVRFHIFELLASFGIRFIFLILLGVGPMPYLIFEIVYNIANNFQHGNLTLNKKIENLIGLIFVTPAIHRMHHTQVEKDMDRNFATIFSFWDKLGGTYLHSNSDEIFPLGIKAQKQNFSLLELLRLPFR